MKSKTFKQIYGATGASRSTINTLLNKGIIDKIQVDYPPISQIVNPPFALATLSAQQQEALDYIQKYLLMPRHQVIVIDGVTGSGKTEVYFHAIAHVLANSTQQVLIMLPEIALISQFVTRFTQQFRFQPIVWNSQVGASKKRLIYEGIVSGDIKVVVGTRSALFLPFPELAIIIIDEEHDSSFKQEDQAVYNARDMAIVRAKLANIPVILSSATPSLETLINSNTNKYHRLSLSTRFGSAGLPKTEVVDMRKSKLGKDKYLSPKLLSEMELVFSHKQQAMLFLNRRGYAPLVLCKSCGYRIQCKNCTTYLTQHQRSNLLCHYCGYHITRPNVCPNCQQEDTLIAFGPGVEKIKEEVLSYFPNAQVALMTSDTIKTSQDAEYFVQQIIQENINLIIGTQIIAKGHHFPKLTLVGIVDAELGLSGGDLRSAERTYQLLHQVSGRAGREQDPGKAIIQSYNPDNVILQTLISGDRERFVQFEEQSRKDNQMPPFGKLVAIIFSGRKESEVRNTAQQIIKAIPCNQDIRVFGPAPAPIAKLYHCYRYRLLIHTSRNINVQKLICDVFAKIKIGRQVKIKVDIDPYSFW